MLADLLAWSEVIDRETQALELQTSHKENGQGNANQLLHWHHSHLLERPVLPHILRTERLHLFIKVIPQHVTPCLHAFAKLFASEVTTAFPTLRQILLELIETFVDLLVLLTVRPVRLKL